MGPDSWFVSSLCKYWMLCSDPSRYADFLISNCMSWLGIRSTLGVRCIKTTGLCPWWKTTTLIRPAFLCLQGWWCRPVTVFVQCCDSALRLCHVMAVWAVMLSLPAVDEEGSADWWFTARKVASACHSATATAPGPEPKQWQAAVGNCGPSFYVAMQELCGFPG